MDQQTTDYRREILNATMRTLTDVPRLRFLKTYGREYRVGPESFSGPRGEAGACYLNATNLALKNRALTYVEGIVTIYGVPVDHAWCVTADGIVVDPTLKAGDDGSYDRITRYFGAPFRTAYLINATLVNGIYGLLDSEHARKTAPKLFELGLDAGQRWLRKAVR